MYSPHAHIFSLGKITFDFEESFFLSESIETAA